MAGKYTGFDRLKGALAKHPGKDPATLAAAKGRKKAAMGDPFGKVGNLTPAQRIQRGRDGKIHEDDPRWNPKTMGNKRGRSY